MTKIFFQLIAPSRTFALFLLLLFLAGNAMGQVSAITAEQKRIFQSGVYYFDLDEATCQPDASATGPDDVSIEGQTMTFPLDDGTNPAVSNSIGPGTASALTPQAKRGAQFTYAVGHKSSIGGIRPDGFNEHPPGKALDIHSSNMGTAVPPGPEFDFLNSLAETFKRNHDALSVSNVIWNNRITSGRDNFATWRPYSGYGSTDNPTLQHKDHIHVFFTNQPGSQQIKLYGVLGTTAAEHPGNPEAPPVGDEGPAGALDESSATACGVCRVDVGGEGLVGNDNIQKAYNYFVSAPRSFTPAQAAGIVGNFAYESGGVNPRSQQIGGGPGRGIAQWEIGGRWDVLLNFARDNGNLDPLDLATQLKFVWHEMSNIAPWSDAIPAVKATNTPENAAVAFEAAYERAGVPALEPRKERAREIFERYGGGESGGVVTTPGNGQDCDSVTGPGQDTQYIDGFTVYSQNDPAWANKPYGSSTIGPSGCGPSAMAMIITALTGRRVTPDVVAKYAGDRGQYIPGAGSAWTLPAVTAPNWGLKAQAIGANIAKINATLQAGGLVITSGQGPKPFTSGGHYIVIRALTADGKWKVGDSAHNDTSDKEWDPQQLLASMNDGSVYAVTK